MHSALDPRVRAAGLKILRFMRYVVLVRRAYLRKLGITLINAALKI